MADPLQPVEPMLKFQSLLRENNVRGGSLTHQKHVQEKVKAYAAANPDKDIPASEGTFSSAFGNNSGRNGINPALLSAVCAVFTADGLRVEPAWWYEATETFRQHVAKATPRPGTLQSGTAVLESELPFPSVVEFGFHQSRGNDADAPILDALLFCGAAELTLEAEAPGAPERTLIIATSELRLAVDPASDFKPRSDGAWAAPATPNAGHLRRVAGGIAVTGPRNQDGYLEGAPLPPDTPFAFLEPNHPGAECFTATVAVPTRHLAIVDAETSQPVSNNKRAILDHLARRRLGVDAAGNAILASATFRPKRQES